ncbi:ECF RNA polymerase sigma-E factor [Polaromonas vacuolata]|uniref:ECF RNA polymerase sigma-E factor n=2 Tax=Polaromonas vacuolata TaxID=37448 RepID=A0A6H2H510_9BURK|nr:ECF RNA polymerase sigma-E factor [Polaromonas vacuolata]
MKYAMHNITDLSNTVDTPVVKPDSQALLIQLVNDHQNRLYRFIVKNIGYGSDAEDLTQQAFVEAVKAYDTFRGASELSTWLYGIAMNLVRNYLSRSPHRRYIFEDDESLADIQSNNPDPSEQLAQTQLIRMLQKEINQLPVEMRDVLLLVALDDLSYEEAATMLSIPVGTVRSRVSRARATLRKRLRENQFEINL